MKTYEFDPSIIPESELTPEAIAEKFVGAFPTSGNLSWDGIQKICADEIDRYVQKLLASAIINTPNMFNYDVLLTCDNLTINITLTECKNESWISDSVLLQPATSTNNLDK